MPVLQSFPLHAGVDNIFRIQDFSAEIAAVERGMQDTFI